MGGSGGAAQGAMQTSLANQGLAANQINAGSSALMSQAGQLNAPLPATMSAISNNIGAVSPGLQSGLATAVNSGGNLSGQTGVNQNAVGQQAIGYETNTGGTNLSQANPALSSFYQGQMGGQSAVGQATPGLNSFYQGEMTGGLNQQTQMNAQNQLQQQLGQQEANLNRTAAPGMNQNNQRQQMQNAELGQSANLAGNLAGQSQAIQAQGAQGLATTAQNQTTAAQQGAQGVASTAGSLDTQTMQMLQNALSGSQGINSEQLQNLMSVLSLGTQAVGQGAASAAQGASDIGAATTAQGQMFSGYSGQASQFGQQAASNQQNSGLGSVFGQAAGLFSPIKL